MSREPVAATVQLTALREITDLDPARSRHAARRKLQGGLSLPGLPQAAVVGSGRAKSTGGGAPLTKERSRDGGPWRRAPRPGQSIHWFKGRIGS